MADRLPVSAFIIARDEADRIAGAIDSVAGWVDEVIVIDSGSSDDTVTVARSRGARAVENAWPGYGPQKRFGEDQCRNDWLLNLDADEAVTPDLEAEIRTLFATGRHTEADCWRIMIRDVYPHEAGPAPWAYGYHQIRLYDRRKGRFSASTVHDTVRPDAGARVASLQGIIAHRSIRSLAFQVGKYNRYSDMQVADMRARGRGLPRWRLLTEFPFAFLKAYVGRRYARYGWWGLILAVNYAHARFLRVAKAYEARLAERTRR
ncbi:glycosyltransferase family 2 protein [Polymorphum gilvum]|uniref:Glycosyl transferase, group 2 family protein, putative n=1 Tax=Polymorphum gilvum (strain LMG 25793 / CGMCC 1.9160 / SL003B-26A1) TaxID=991905 RepID=F2J112_POLGS|nr:glycosyltransferase family 2 protein [Polymorphum gilvum]ADZ71958.1 Glycosyl transferase, group 2 family protein, putative [Polymorphum gilvum SL003B-26A1]